MAFVHNPDRGAADLVVLAAQDFTGEPVARVHLPARIPLGFHGSWVPTGKTRRPRPRRQAQARPAPCAGRARAVRRPQLSTASGYGRYRCRPAGM